MGKPLCHTGRGLDSEKVIYMYAFQLRQTDAEWPKANQNFKGMKRK